MLPLTRERLAGIRHRRLHGGRNFTKAVVDLVEVDGQRIVVKDLALRPWPVRALLGPLQIGREARAYRRLEGVVGIPRLLARLDAAAIAIEYVPGPDLREARPGDLPGVFFDRLAALLEAVHARGVAHGDLHRRDVLIGPGDQPFLVDFSTAIIAGPDADPLQRFLFAQMCEADRRSLAKLRRRMLPGWSGLVPARKGLYRVGGLLRRLRLARRRRAAGGRRDIESGR
jgi:tRNA A-37 threonylcarbamoyl transferase component Bud32